MITEGTIFWVFLIGGVVWLVILFLVFRSIACRNDISLMAKAGWLIVVFLFPVLGLIAYMALGKNGLNRA